MSILLKMAVLVSVSVLGLSVLSGFSYVSSDVGSTAMDTMYNTGVRQYLDVNNLVAKARELHLGAYRVTTEFTSGVTTLQESAVSAHQAKTKLTGLSTLLAELERRRSLEVKEVREALAGYATFITLWADDLEQSGGMSASFFLASADDAFNQLDSSLQSVVDRTSSHLLQVHQESQDALSMTKQVVIWGSIAVTFLVLLVGVAIAYGVATPIRGIIPVIQRIAHGDLSDKFVVNRADEVGQVVHAVESLRESQAKLIRAVKADADLTAKSTHELLTASVETASSAEELQAIALSISKEVQGLTQRVKSFANTAESTNAYATEVATLVESVSKSTTTVADSAEKMSVVLGKATSAVDEKLKGVYGMQSTAEDAKKRLEDSVQQVARLSKSFSEISSMTSVILNVSQSTHILGINAAIQSAHAGVYGRGFSVVAQEIQTLSASTEKSAKQIDNMLYGMTKVLEELSVRMTDVSNAFSALLNGISQSVQAFDDTRAHIRSSRDSAQGIALSVQMVSTQASVISDKSQGVRKLMSGTTEEVQVITNVMRSVHDAITEMTYGISDLTKASHVVQEQSTVTQESSQDLVKSLERFKLGG